MPTPNIRARRVGRILVLSVLALDAIERKAADELGEADRLFFAEVAWQELEVWVLAGQQDLPSTWSWQAIRNECDPKEVYYEEYARRRGLLGAAYEGREILAKEAARKYERIRALCPEDVRALEERIASALGK